MLTPHPLVASEDASICCELAMEPDAEDTATDILELTPVQEVWLGLAKYLDLLFESSNGCRQPCKAKEEPRA